MSDRALMLVARIEQRILRLRGHSVMLDADLAILYGTDTRALVQAVRRNRERFPPDFMFQLTSQEFQRLRSQSVIPSPGLGGRRSAPYAFTEQGVAIPDQPIMRGCRAGESREPDVPRYGRSKRRA